MGPVSPDNRCVRRAAQRVRTRHWRLGSPLSRRYFHGKGSDATRTCHLSRSRPSATHRDRSLKGTEAQRHREVLSETGSVSPAKLHAARTRTRPPDANRQRHADLPVQVSGRIGRVPPYGVPQDFGPIGTITRCSPLRCDGRSRSSEAPCPSSRPPRSRPPPPPNAFQADRTSYQAGCPP